MESFFSRYKNVLALIVVLLAQVIGLAVQVRRPAPGATSADGHNVRLIRYWVTSLVTPPERALHAVGSSIRGFWANYIYFRGTRKENRDLKAEIERLRLEQASLLEDARQGKRLQQLLAFKERYIYQTLPAQVIGTSGSDQSHVLYIDKGSRDGLKPDMPVITPDGIVGKIRDVFPHTAQVLEISDQSSGAGVLLETTRIRGILRGNNLGQPQIINIMPDERIKPGERVLTSGGDEVFPRGLLVGVVDRVVRDPERDPFVDVILRPAANLPRLEEVLVITSLSDRLPPSQERDLAKSEALGAVMDEKQRAADILAERLPGLDKPEAAPDAQAAAATGEPPPPPKPLPTIHPDRFTPAGVPPASQMTPGQPPPARSQAAGGATPSGSAGLPGSARPVPGNTLPAGQGGSSQPRPAAQPKPAAPVAIDPLTGQPVKPVKKPKPPTAATPAPPAVKTAAPETTKPASEPAPAQKSGVER